MTDFPKSRFAAQDTDFFYSIISQIEAKTMATICTTSCQEGYGYCYEGRTLYIQGAAT